MRPIRWLVALLLVALALASCSVGGSDAGGGEEDRAPSAQDEWADAEGAGDGGGEPAPDAGGDADADAGADREVITTGSMSIVVDDARAAADEVARIVETAGGRVDERSEQAGSDDAADASAWLTVRVPSADLTATLDDLEQLGEVQDLTIRSEDVTRQTRDLDARIAALQTSTDRLLALMADAGTSADLLAAESALSDRQAELESLQSERAYLGDQVALSTLRIGLFTQSAPQLEAEGFVGGLTTGWNALVSFASALLVALGVALPWLLALAVVVAVAVPLLHRRRRRSAPEPPATASAATADDVTPA